MNLFCAGAMAVGLSLLGANNHVRAEESDTERAKPTSRTERVVQGWKVAVDDRLLASDHADLGRQALTFLEGDLANIANLLGDEQLERLRAVRIVLDLWHGELRTMQYHPSAEWLERHGYATELAKCVHIPAVRDYTSRRHRHEQPWCVLHELAHAFHDQVLGFETPRILAAWKAYKESGHGDSVLHIGARHIRHYALTDQKEFFAEMSEAYLGMNDFFPFNNSELKEAEPEIWKLLESIWGPVP